MGARYEITGPDGHRYEVNAPDGATEQQVLNRLKAHVQVENDPISKGARAWRDTTPEEMIAGSAPVRFALGAASPFIGAAQLGANAIGGDTASAVNEHVAQLEQMKKRGMEARGSEGIDWTGLAGTVLNPVGLATAKLAGPKTLAGRVGAGAAIGAGYGATSPVTEGDFWPTKAAQTGTGAVIGGAIPVASDLVTKPAKGLYHAVEPWLPGGVRRIEGRTANAAAGDKRQAVINELRKNQQLVPGSQPTAGEAAVPAGSTEFAALQKAVTPYRPSEYADIASKQDTARVLSLDTVAGKPGEKETFEAMRGSVADAYYGKAYDKGVNIMRDPITGQFRSKREIAGIKGEITKLLKRPSIKEVVKEAKKKAADEGIKTSTTGSVQGMHYMKRALDDKIKAAEGDDKRILTALKDRLLTTIDNLSPDYAAARQKYAEMSTPINQMDVGRFLENKLTPALNDFGASSSQRAGVYAQAVRDAPGTLKKSTGFNRYENLDQVLDPTQLATVEGVASDLGRKATFEQQAGLGREAIATQLGKQTHEVQLPNLLHRGAMLTNAILRRLQGGAGEKTLKQLALDMQNPAEMAKIMEAATPAQRSALIRALNSNPVKIGAPVSAAMEGF